MSGEIAVWRRRKTMASQDKKALFEFMLSRVKETQKDCSRRRAASLRPLVCQTIFPESPGHLRFGWVQGRQD